MSAVMQRDDRMMAYLWAPFRLQVQDLDEKATEEKLAAFRREIDVAHAGFARAKETGQLPEDPLGVAMFRAMRLGKGAFTIPLGAQVAEDGRTAVVRTRLNTNLDNLQLDSLPTGVLVYAAGYPFGRLERISVNYEEMADKAFLASVDIEWHLVRAPEGMSSPSGWLIESFRADPETAVMWEQGRR